MGGYRKQVLRNYETKLDFTYLTDLAMPTLLEQLQHLPSNTIVFHTAISQDAAGERFVDSTQSVTLGAWCRECAGVCYGRLWISGRALWVATW